MAFPSIDEGVREQPGKAAPCIDQGVALVVGAPRRRRVGHRDVVQVLEVRLQFHGPEVAQLARHAHHGVDALGEVHVGVGGGQRFPTGGVWRRRRSVEVRRLHLAVQAGACRPHRPSCRHVLRPNTRLEQRRRPAARVGHGMQARRHRPRLGRAPLDLGKRLEKQRIHLSIPAPAHRPERQAVLPHGVRHPHKGLDAVVERPKHGVRVQSHPKGGRAFLHLQFAVGVGGQRHAFLVEQVAHQRLGADVGERGVPVCKGQVARHEFVAAVLPVAADGQRRFEVRAFVDRLGVGRPHNAHARAEELVAVVVAVDVALGPYLVRNQDVHAAVSAEAPK